MRNVNLFLNKLYLYFFVLILQSSILSFFSGCSAGGDLINPTPEKSTSVVVPIPIVVSPSDAIHYSNQNTLVISGMCQSDSTVKLTGLYDTQSFICVNSAFSFTVSQAADGINYYNIQQTQIDGSVSYPVNVIWVRKSTVSQPLLTSPNINPYFSSQNQIVISGTCESEATVSLSGDGVGSVVCANSLFSLTLPKSVDGDYNIVVTQTDKAGNSANRTLVWNKHALTVSPQSATIPVNTELPISVSGGSGVYTLTLQQNNSGGSLDTATNKYTTGTLAGVIDQIKVVDSLGAQFLLNIATVAGTVDHMSFANVSGDNQTVSVNTTLPVSLTAKVVDEFENPIVLYPVYFRHIQGDGELLDSSIQITDLTGQVQMRVKSGSSAIKNVVEVAPLASLLPDVAGSGHSKLRFNYTTTFSNKAKFGTTFTLSTNPIQVLSQDFNGDSIVDTLVLNNGEPSLGVLLGLGNGLFGSMSKVKPICTNPTYMTTADINNDGHSDIVIVCGSAAYGQGAALANVMQYFLGDGLGHFGSAVNIPIDLNESVPTQVVVGDFNGDGKADLALAVSNYLAANTVDDGAVTFRFGNGSGSFSAPQYIETGKGTNGLVAGYFNSTSKLDLAVINSTVNQLQFLFNTTASVGGAVSFDTSNTQGVDPSPLQIQKLTVNSKMALAVLTGSGKLNLFNDDGTMSGSFAPIDPINVGLSVTAMAIADLNHDSIDDIVVSNSDENNLSHFKGQSDGSFIAQPNIATTGTPVSVVTADVNQDIYKDLLVIGAESSVLEFIPGRSNGTFGFSYDVTDNAGSITKSVAADLDGDGKLDLAVLSATDKNIHILKGQANGLFSQLGSTLDTNDNSTSIVAADFRGNGIKDLVVTNPARNNVRVFLGLGNGGFSAPVDYAVGNGPTAAVFADLNRDGNLDLIVSNGTGNSITILYGDGHGTFPTKFTKAVGTNPVGVVVTDLNNDAVLDVVALSRGDSKINVLMGSGLNSTYILSSAVSYDVGTDGTADPTALTVHDVNNDGVPDVITANSGDGTVSVFIGSGDGSYQASRQYPAVDAPSGILTGDFTGDGKLDIALYSASSSILTILPGSASGTYSGSPVTIDTVIPLGGFLSADFNDDHLVDIITYNFTGHLINVWLGH